MEPIPAYGKRILRRQPIDLYGLANSPPGGADLLRLGRPPTPI